MKKKIEEKNIYGRSGFPTWDLSHRDIVQSYFLFVSTRYAKMVEIPGF